MFKIIKIFISVIIGVGIFYGGFYIGANVSYWYLWKKETQWVRDMADSMKRLEKEDYERAMADTFGGKTPQETLQMFIDAVEKGDYELASEYFIEEKRGEWRGIIKELDESGLDWFLNKMLKNANIFKEGASDNFYTIESVSDTNKNIKYSSISFTMYSNNVWKIDSIEPKNF